MPSWVIGVAGTFVLSLIIAYGFLRLRCRGIGPPVGPRAESPAILLRDGEDAAVKNSRATAGRLVLMERVN